MKNYSLSDTEANFIAGLLKSTNPQTVSVKDEDTLNFLRKVFVPTPVKLTFSDVRKLAEAAGEKVVNDFLKTHPEPMYCGVAYLFTLVPKPRSRTGKKMEGEHMRPTGFAGRTQSLDLQEMWCDAASKVFAQHGFEVHEKSWVD